MTIDIICPLYNAENYVVKQLKQIEMQSYYNYIKNIRYVITKGQDNTAETIRKQQEENNKIIYKEIEPKDFSHSLTREKEAFESNADIVVFITQDVLIEKKDWLEKLVNPIENNECEACYSRQICDNNTIEKYTRECNYPAESKIVSKEDINKLGLKTFFFSDASAAIKRETFVELGGYDKKKLPISEDMYIAYKIIMNGYKIKYCADSEVIHSHEFTLKQYYNRYKATGKFFKENDYLNNYKVNKAGGNMAIYVLKRAWQDKNWKVLVRYISNMAARFIGMKVGKKTWKTKKLL